MLFISIFTYEPENRDAILKRRAEGLFKPAGAECLGQWSCTSGGRTFTLFDADDPLVMFQWVHAWSDLGKFEVHPVVDTEELIKAFASQR